MAISGIFLIVFLTQHLLINITSIFPDNGVTFNKISHFMGYNPIIQFVLQPILIFGVCFHFFLGFILEFNNRNKRKDTYRVSSSRASWVSKNMIISGGVVLLFLLLHFYDFWFPEINYKYINPAAVNYDRYFEELVHKFKGNTVRTCIYCLSFVFLGLHLLHGFSSSLQTLGARTKYLIHIKFISTIYSFIIVSGFILIALFHYF